MMKRLWILILVLAMAMPLVACSEEAPEEEATAQTVPAQEGPSAMDEAMMLVGSPVEELLLLVGQPEKIEYFPSAMSEEGADPIEEGVYYYSDFVVYTIKEGASEQIFDVAMRQEN